MTIIVFRDRPTAEESLQHAWFVDTTQAHVPSTSQSAESTPSPLISSLNSPDAVDTNTTALDTGTKCDDSTHALNEPVLAVVLPHREAQKPAEQATHETSSNDDAVFSSPPSSRNSMYMSADSLLDSASDKRASRCLDSSGDELDRSTEYLDLSTSTAAAQYHQAQCDYAAAANLNNDRNNLVTVCLVCPSHHAALRVSGARDAEDESSNGGSTSCNLCCVDMNAALQQQQQQLQARTAPALNGRCSCGTHVSRAMSQHDDDDSQCTHARHADNSRSGQVCLSCDNNSAVVTSPSNMSSQLCVDYFNAKLAQLSIDSVYDIPCINMEEAICSVHDVSDLDLLNANDVNASEHDNLTAGEHLSHAGSSRHHSCDAESTVNTAVTGQCTTSTHVDDDRETLATTNNAIATRLVDDGCHAQPNHEYDLNCNNNNCNNTSLAPEDDATNGGGHPIYCCCCCCLS